jgi:hypothetical protein
VVGRNKSGHDAARKSAGGISSLTTWLFRYHHAVNVDHGGAGDDQEYAG